MSKTALIAGATGLVGGHLLDQILEDEQYSKVIVLSRRSLGGDDGKLKECIIKDFDKLEDHISELQADDYFCCLGTTMKKAGSKAAFKKVDFEYPVSLAAIARENNASSFHLISAMGADSNSFIFYNKVKGETEDAIKSMKLNKAFIYRPSFIAGERTEKRTAEKAALWFADKLDFIFSGPLKKYAAVDASKIASSMIKMAHSNNSTFKVLLSDEINEIG
ncbi:NAD-dependent epimerase/dehydratase family protein [Marivirga arenosa]|uniref:NAD-dependent epimerase/dehydratase family protein n=1 Tax=Marivirga arenosa TaxID=3059076 RepID=A0AA51X517_9BACT|nr:MULTISPECIES: NAD-dependent epimerase/dehydratase family protein [unclassified Marivirga]WKK84979.2 NAD-dependent epimerase/dehydratase family protein [Marivirga sp. ABR2-2]WNB17208.1 NAD-dependent epimerase/dehydratase family protein [Marivirga sp. BKB1-2]